MNFPDYYAVLGLPRFYPTQEEIRDAFLRKLTELHDASPDVNPDARQELDTAFLTLSDAKKKRQYDEVLDRYVQAEEADASEKVVISAYNYRDAYTVKHTVSLSPLSKKVYDFLCQKFEDLTEISSRYPFTSKSDIEERWFFEIGMLILYNSFFCAYMNDYLWEKLMQFLSDGISIMALSYPIEDDEDIKKQLMSVFLHIKTDFLRAAACPKDDEETTLDYMAIVYIVYTSSGNDIMQKIEQPEFQEAFVSMKREVSEFLEKFFYEKDFVT